MSEVAVAYVSLIPSARGFRRRTERALGPGIRGAGASLGSQFGSALGRGASRSFLSGTSSITTALNDFQRSALRSSSGISAAVGGLAAAGAGIGIKLGANLQTAAVGMETLTGSGEQATEMMTRLREFAVRSPFEVEGLIGNARALLGVGESAASVIPTLQTLGDVTSAYGLNQEQFNGILRAYTQISAKGTVQAEELLQMAENGLPAAQLMAKSLGLTTQGLLNLTRNGQLAAKDALPALQKALRADFGGSMAKQFNTLTGQFNNFKESVKLGLSDLFKPLLPSIQRTLPRVTGAFTDFVAGITNSGDKLPSGKFAAFGARVRDVFVNTIIPAAQRFGGWVKNDLWPALSLLLNSIRQGFRDMGANFSKAFGDFNKSGASDAISGFGDVLTKIVIPAVAKFYSVYLPALGTALGFAAKVAYKVGQAFVDLSLAGVRAFAWLAKGVLSAIGAILWAADKVRFLFPGLGDEIHTAKQNFDKFRDNVVANLDSVEAGLISVREALANIKSKQITIDVVLREAALKGEGSKRVANAVAEQQRLKAEEAAKQIRKNTKRVALNTGKAVTDQAKSISDAVKKASEKAKSALEEARQAFADYAKSVSDNIKSFGNLTTITSSTGAAATPNSLLRFLRNQLNKIKRFQADLKILASRGLSNSLLKQIADAGIDGGGPVARALVRSNPKQFKAITALDKQIGGAADAIGGRVAQTLFGGQVAAAQAKVVNVTINNPVPERATTSLPKALRRAAVVSGT